MPTTASDLSASLNAQPQLEVINERRVASGEETDDEDEEGEFRSANNEGDGDGVNGETVVLSGYLWKKGERRKVCADFPFFLSPALTICDLKTWKKRWFVLRTQKLAYYKNEQEYKLLRLLDLRDIHSAITVSLKHHQNTFGIVTPTRTFYIQAASTPERDNWVRRLNEVRAKLKDSIATPPIMTDTAAAAAASGVTSTATQATKAASIPVTMGASASTTTATPSRKTALRSLAKSLTPPSPNATFAFPSSISPTSASPTAAGFGITSSDSDDPFTAATTSPRAQKNKSAAQDSAQGIVNDPKKVVLSGYLMKCGSKRKNWRKRWFVLTSEKLVYAKSHMVCSMTSLIKLQQSNVVCTIRTRNHTARFPSTES